MPGFRCKACPRDHRCVHPSGPNECDYHFVGEAPGKEEDDKDVPFCGKTGKEVNEHYLPLAGLSRPGVRFTNAIRCLPSTPQHKLDLKKQDHRDLLSSCASYHLYPELSASSESRKVLVPLGAFACYAVDREISLDVHHGVAIDTQWGPTFPMYHPAGGIHEPKKMLMIRTDWYRLRQFLEGRLLQPVDAHPNPDYKEVINERQLSSYLGVSGFKQALACDTESKRNGSPFCLSLSTRTGTGRVIRSDNPRVLRKLQEYLLRWQGPILFHNWLYDWEVVEEMDLHFPLDRVVDTMVKVFHLGNLPQGLKSLAYRELGMEMQDFDDLVTPYSREIVLDYYRNAMCEEWPVPAEELIRDSSGAWKKYKPQGFNTKLKRFWVDVATGRDKDVFDLWTNNWEEHHAQVEKIQGPWPGKCISHVPWSEVIYYACRDADATLRLWPILKHMESRVGKVPQEQWRDIA